MALPCDIIPPPKHRVIRNPPGQRSSFTAFKPSNWIAVSLITTTQWCWMKLPIRPALPKTSTGTWLLTRSKIAAMRAVFTEYAWDKNWSDPCDANPLNPEELQSLGVFWLTETPPGFRPGSRAPFHHASDGRGPRCDALFVEERRPYSYM